MEAIPIRNPFPGAASYLVAKTDSTQDEARRLAALGRARGRALGPAFPHGSLVAALEQSAGRGRFPDRSWESAAGKNLLFTLFLEPGTAALPGLPIRIGLALCAAASGYARAVGASFPRPPRVKWPNDLMFGDKKAAGILCEASPSGLFAGIGLNCNQLSFPPSLGAGATSLAAELGVEVSLWPILELFLDELRAGMYSPIWRLRAEELLWKKGEDASFAPGRGSRILRGIPTGIDDSGSLLFLENGQKEALSFAAGEFKAGETR